MPLIVRRYMNKCTPSRSNLSPRISGLASPRTLGTLLFSVPLLIGGFATAQTPQKSTVQVSLVSSKECSNKSDFSGTSIAIDGTRVEIKRGSTEYIQLAPGSHSVSGLGEPDYPEAKMTAVRVRWAGRVLQERPADASGGVTITLEASVFSVPSQLPGIEIVTENDCRKKTPIQEKGTPEAKRFFVGVTTPDCKDPFFKNLEIRIRAVSAVGTLTQGETKITNFRVAQADSSDWVAAGEVELKPGTYWISVFLLGYMDTSVQEVEVEANFFSKGKFQAESHSSDVKVILDDQIWDNSVTSQSLKIKLTGNCADPDFFNLKVLAVTGKVEIIGPGVNDKPREAKVNDSIFAFQTFTSTIRTSSGGSIILESEHGHLITISEYTEVQTNLIMTANGREKLEAFIKRGKIQIKRVIPERSSESSESNGINVRTPVATITDKETLYMVSHDHMANLTSVGVQEGKVEVTPVNTSLKPLTLGANQQLQVSESSVSAIIHYSGESARATGMLLYVAIGAAALVGLVVVAGIAFLFRRVNRPPVQPAFQQSGMKVEATPANFMSPAVVSGEWRCPNPQCGKLVPAGKKFCTACGGTQAGFKAEAAPVSIASPAVATSERRCPNPQCGKLVPAAKKFCTACGTPVI